MHSCARAGGHGGRGGADQSREVAGHSRHSCPEINHLPAVFAVVLNLASFYEFHAAGTPATTHLVVIAIKFRRGGRDSFGP
ncbi:hypothetical protein EVAR_13451_1 [Eumeta japonica]|uniref:Uncharacterized protein n=1 Tax=Eumeta variegata TaxID=151549 RepID=A0A4C1UZE9_EUMVA|nr:hypothetical protein EVAR_13451_1 [Eumeta japonica]